MGNVGQKSRPRMLAGGVGERGRRQGLAHIRESRARRESPCIPWSSPWSCWLASSPRRCLPRSCGNCRCRWCKSWPVWWWPVSFPLSTEWTFRRSCSWCCSSRRCCSTRRATSTAARSGITRVPSSRWPWGLCCSRCWRWASRCIGSCRPSLWPPPSPVPRPWPPPMRRPWARWVLALA